MAWTALGDRDPSWAWGSVDSGIDRSACATRSHKQKKKKTHIRKATEGTARGAPLHSQVCSPRLLRSAPSLAAGTSSGVLSALAAPPAWAWRSRPLLGCRRVWRLRGFFFGVRMQVLRYPETRKHQERRSAWTTNNSAPHKKKPVSRVLCAEAPPGRRRLGCSTRDLLALSVDAWRAPAAPPGPSGAFSALGALRLSIWAFRAAALLEDFRSTEQEQS